MEDQSDQIYYPEIYNDNYNNERNSVIYNNENEKPRLKKKKVKKGKKVQKSLINRSPIRIGDDTNRNNSV